MYHRILHYNLEKRRGTCDQCGRVDILVEHAQIRCASSRRENRRRYKRLTKYGVTDEEYIHLYSIQEGKCAICGIFLEVLAIDHNHITGDIRGLLCRSCNLGLGLFKDQKKLLRKAAIYLKGSSA